MSNITVEELFSPVQRLAELLHELKCNKEHADQCDWFFSNWKHPDNLEFDDRKRYFNKAQRLLKLFGDNYDKVIESLKAEYNEDNDEDDDEVFLSVVNEVDKRLLRMSE